MKKKTLKQIGIVAIFLVALMLISNSLFVFIAYPETVTVYRGEKSPDATWYVGYSWMQPSQYDLDGIITDREQWDAYYSHVFQGGETQIAWGVGDCRYSPHGTFVTTLYIGNDDTNTWYKIGTKTSSPQPQSLGNLCSENGFTAQTIPNDASITDIKTESYEDGILKDRLIFENRIIVEYTPTPEEQCISDGFYWYDNQCNENPEQQEIPEPTKPQPKGFLSLLGQFGEWLSNWLENIFG